MQLAACASAGMLVNAVLVTCLPWLVAADGARAAKHKFGSNASSEYTPDSDDGDSAGGSSSHLSGSAAAVASRAPPSAVCLMPAIDAPRPPVKGRHPTDAELKQQIAALQTRAALSYNPDRSARRCLLCTTDRCSACCCASSAPSLSCKADHVVGKAVGASGAGSRLCAVADTAAAARCECLMRYREKKLRRLDSNTIRYMKRKINADKRPRCACVTKHVAGIQPKLVGERLACTLTHAVISQLYMRHCEGQLQGIGTTAVLTSQCRFRAGSRAAS